MGGTGVEARTSLGTAEAAATALPAIDVGVETGAVAVGFALPPRGGRMMICVDPNGVRTDDVPTAITRVPYGSRYRSP